MSSPDVYRWVLRWQFALFVILVEADREIRGDSAIAVAVNAVAAVVVAGSAIIGHVSAKLPARI